MIAMVFVLYEYIYDICVFMQGIYMKTPLNLEGERGDVRASKIGIICIRCTILLIISFCVCILAKALHIVHKVFKCEFVCVTINGQLCY